MSARKAQRLAKKAAHSARRSIIPDVLRASIEDERSRLMTAAARSGGAEADRVERIDRVLDEIEQAKDQGGAS